MTLDLYAVLRVKRTARPATIERAYRRRARETHPDRGGDPEQFRQVDFAYSILSDPVTRKRYDETGEATERKPDQAEALVMRVISGVLGKVITAMVEQGRKPESEDVLAAMRQTLASARQEFTTARGKVVKFRAAVLATAERFTVEGGENLVAGVATIHLAELDAQLANLDTEAKAIGDALALLARYRYRFQTMGFSAFRPTMFWDIGAKTQLATST